MGSFFKKPRCECGRERVLSALGYTYRPCVCAPRPPVPKGPSDVSSLCIRPQVDLRPTDSKPRDLLTEDERAKVEVFRKYTISIYDLGWIGYDVLAALDRVAPKPEVEK